MFKIAHMLKYLKKVTDVYPKAIGRRKKMALTRIPVMKV